MPRVTEALIRYNAERCEAAQSSKCRCACGGEFHGKKHSDAWIAACAEAYRRAAIDESQSDFFSDSEAAKPRAAAGRRRLRLRRRSAIGQEASVVVYAHRAQSAHPSPPAEPPATPASPQWYRVSLVKGLETVVTEIEVVEEYKRWLSVPWSHARERVAKARKTRQVIRTARYRFEYRGGDAT